MANDDGGHMRVAMNILDTVFLWWEVWGVVWEWWSTKGYTYVVFFFFFYLFLLPLGIGCCCWIGTDSRAGCEVRPHRHRPTVPTWEAF